MVLQGGSCGVAAGGAEVLRSFAFNFKLKRQSCVLGVSRETLAALLPEETLKAATQQQRQQQQEQQEQQQQQ